MGLINRVLIPGLQLPSKGLTAAQAREKALEQIAKQKEIAEQLEEQQRQLDQDENS